MLMKFYEAYQLAFFIIISNHQIILKYINIARSSSVSQYLYGKWGR